MRAPTTRIIIVIVSSLQLSLRNSIFFLVYQQSFQLFGAYVLAVWLCTPKSTANNPYSYHQRFLLHLTDTNRMPESHCTCYLVLFLLPCPRNMRAWHHSQDFLLICERFDEQCDEYLQWLAGICMYLYILEPGSDQPILVSPSEVPQNRPFSNRVTSNMQDRRIFSNSQS